MTPSSRTPHTHDPLAKRVFDRIESERLTPRPRWEFLFKDYFFWGLGVLAVILGAVAFSAMAFELSNADWQFASVTHTSLFSFALDAAPVLWIVSLVLFVGLGYVNVRRTKHGYRYPLAVITLGAILTSLSLGSVLATVGIGSAVESVAHNIPFHRPLAAAEQMWWRAPVKGLLGGVVVSSAPEVTSFVLRDFMGQEWQVDGSDLRTPDLAVIARGGVVRVIGVPTSATSSTFHACFAFPWEVERPSHLMRPPLPLAFVASTTGRGPGVVRSDSCRQIHPYAKLHALDEVSAEEL